MSMRCDRQVNRRARNTTRPVIEHRNDDGHTSNSPRRHRSWFHGRLTPNPKAPSSHKSKDRDLQEGVSIFLTG